MGQVWACLLAKLSSDGGPILEVENNSVDLQCCNCEEASTASTPKAVAPPPAREGTGTDVTQVPSEFWSPRTTPPREMFEGAPAEVTVVNITA